ncbi:AAA family ATPase [Bacillus sp. NP157]|nr:AAA family ATPase [Bacillus sp. NP157]
MSLRRGLVVGKFSPLHLGHEYLVNQALAACDELTVLAYSQPSFERCDAATRERWLRLRFPRAARIVVLDDARLAAAGHTRRIPHNDEPDDVQRAFACWLCTDVLGTTFEVVFTSEDYGRGFAASLTDWFTTHVPGYAGVVEHVSVDRERATIPVSATRIRQDPAAARRWLAPEVHADYVRRACILGGESTGKSTLCVDLATRLDTTHVDEYGRELWVARDGALRYDDMLHIGEVQCAREDEAARGALGWLVCDTSPLTTLFYNHALFGRADPLLEALAARRYDHVFLCAPEFPFVQDGTRQDEAFRDRQHAWYLDELGRRGMPFTLLRGDREQRCAAAAASLATAGALSGAG